MGHDSQRKQEHKPVHDTKTHANKRISASQRTSASRRTRFFILSIPCGTFLRPKKRMYTEREPSARASRATAQSSHLVAWMRVWGFQAQTKSSWASASSRERHLTVFPPNAWFMVHCFKFTTDVSRFRGFNERCSHLTRNFEVHSEAGPLPSPDVRCTTRKEPSSSTVTTNLTTCFRVSQRSTHP